MAKKKRLVIKDSRGNVVGRCNTMYEATDICLNSIPAKERRQHKFYWVYEGDEKVGRVKSKYMIATAKRS